MGGPGWRLRGTDPEPAAARGAGTRGENVPRQREGAPRRLQQCEYKVQSIQVHGNVPGNVQRRIWVLPLILPSNCMILKKKSGEQGAGPSPGSVSDLPHLGTRYTVGPAEF